MVERHVPQDRDRVPDMWLAAGGVAAARPLDTRQVVLADTVREEGEDFIPHFLCSTGKFS